MNMSGYCATIFCWILTFIYSLASLFYAWANEIFGNPSFEIRDSFFRIAHFSLIQWFYFRFPFSLWLFLFVLFAFAFDLGAGHFQEVEGLCEGVENLALSAVWAATWEVVPAWGSCSSSFSSLSDSTLTSSSSSFWWKIYTKGIFKKIEDLGSMVPARVAERVCTTSWCSLNATFSK